MYCSVDRKDIGGAEAEREGAEKGAGYHWDIKPYGCSWGIQKKTGPPSDDIFADMVLPVNRGMDTER